MDYSQFAATDFAQDDFFIRWVKNPDRESDAYWSDVLSRFPHLKHETEKARLFILAAQPVEIFTASEEQKVRMWNKIEEGTRVERGGLRWTPGGRWLAAASVAALFLAGGLLWRMNVREGVKLVLKTEKAGLDPVGMVERKNVGTTPEKITLSDGSVVTLDPNGKLTYPKAFSGDKRTVYLTGEAFFEVVKNPSVPFFVYANEVVAKVLGTSFRVKAYASEKNVTVEVKTGRVSVYSPQSAGAKTDREDPETKGVVLTPNQQAVFLRSELRLAKSLVEKPVIIIPKAQLDAFVFERAPVGKIFAAIEKAYGVDLVFDEELVKNCTMTTSLQDENLFDKLEIICKLLGASYKVIDAQIVINLKGC